MARRIGFYPIMVASFAITVALTVPTGARAQVPAPATAPAPVLTPQDIAATVERVASLLQNRYVVPATGARYAAALRTNAAAGRYAGLTDPATLGKRITADLQAVAPDGHVSIRPAYEAPSKTEATVAPQPPAVREVAPGIRETRWLRPGVAYLAFSHFSDDPTALAALDAFFRQYRSAKALVIDAREHRGGSFAMLGVLGDRLFGTARPLAEMDVAKSVVDENGVPFPEGPELRRVAAPEGLVRFEHRSVPATDGATLFDVPVYYLTSRRTFSAAEHMAMVLKGTGRATLVGEATGGGNHFGGTEAVGPGLEMFLPIGRTTDPKTGEDWEGHGVAPDVVVPADRALETALGMVTKARR